MRERLKQLAAATTLVLVAGGSLVACSDDGGSSADGVGESAGGTLTKANFFDEVTQAQAKASTSHVNMAVDVAGQALKLDGDVRIGDSAADTAMALSMDSGQAGMGSLEMRLVDEKFYINFGSMTSNKFALIDLTDENNPIGEQLGGVIDGVDPAQQFKDVENAMSGFEKKGDPIELDGVQAQPYVVTIDTSKIPEAEQAGGSLPESLEYTMYIGPDNLPRRVVSDLSGVAGAGSKATINYTKWGEDVSIAKPKKSEITEKDLFSQLGGATPEAS